MRGTAPAARTAAKNANGRAEVPALEPTVTRTTF